MARPPRFEHGTLALEMRCSIQLSYGRIPEKHLKPNTVCQRLKGQADPSLEARKPQEPWNPWNQKTPTLKTGCNPGIDNEFPR